MVVENTHGSGIGVGVGARAIGFRSGPLDADDRVFHSRFKSSLCCLFSPVASNPGVDYDRMHARL